MRVFGVVVVTLVILTLVLGVAVLSAQNDEPQPRAGDNLSTAKKADGGSSDVKVKALEEKLLKLKVENSKLRKELDDLKKNYYLLKKNPSYKEVKRFLILDSTDIPTHEKRLCYHYALQMLANATEHGLYASPVVLIFPNAGHMLVGFNTSDRGIIYVDPAYDFEVNITLGEDYFRENGLKSKYSGVVIDYATTWDWYPKKKYR